MDVPLFQPFKLGTLELKNRIVMPAMSHQFADAKGFVTDRLISYYAERARGGVAMIVVEAASVALGGLAAPRQPGAHDDKFLPGLSRLAKSIQQAGCPAMLQIHHGGRYAPAAFNDGIQPIAPSPIAGWGKPIPRELTVDEIAEIEERFADATLRAKQAGFDGVEVHAAHGYLLSQFLSALTNKRRDRYGGDVQSRARICTEVVERIRAKVGPDFPLLVRINGDDYIMGGLRPREAAQVAQLLEQAGVTAISVSASYRSSSEEGYANNLITLSMAPMTWPRGLYLGAIELVKKKVGIPVIAVGRLDDFALANRVLLEGKADLIAIGRGLVADPYLPQKYRENRLDEVRRCLACNTCIDTLGKEGQSRCAINPDFGNEEEYRITPCGQPKKVVVVGGGPAGLEAAKVLAARGHAVTLIDRRPALGGALFSASAVSYKKDFLRYIVDYYLAEFKNLGVRLLLNQEADAAFILGLQPDAVILATGAVPDIPAIPGADGANVSDGVAVLEGRYHTGPRPIVVGAGLIGCETAEYLAEQGKEVVLVTRRDSDFAPDAGLAVEMEATLRRWFLFERLPELPIEIVAKSTYKAVTPEGLIVEDREGNQRLIAGDTVVFALGMRATGELQRALEGKVEEVHVVGDAVAPRRILQATHEAAQAARLV